MMAVTPSDTALGSTLQTPSKTSTARAELSAVPDGDELAAIGRSENPQPPRSGRYRTEAPMLALAPPQGKYYIDRLVLQREIKAGEGRRHTCFAGVCFS